MNAKTMNAKHLMKQAITIAADGGPKEFTPMNHMRIFMTASIVLAGIAVSGIAFAQDSDSSKPSKVKQVETWTQKQWDAAKKDWAKDKAKWAACQKQSKDQKLQGRKSWSFLYTCMTN